MAGSCKTKHKEHGIWFKIETIANIIKSKEARGESAKFERDLLKSWGRYEGYESAKEALIDVKVMKGRRKP